MSVEQREQWIGLLAAEEDRARIQKHLEDLDFHVWVPHPAEPPSGVSLRGAPEVLIVSIPSPPQALEAEPLQLGCRRIQADSYLQDTWHGVIRELRDQGVAILAAVPAQYPALAAVFASGATEVLEGEVTRAALEARLRALRARLQADLGTDTSAESRSGGVSSPAGSPRKGAVRTRTNRPARPLRSATKRAAPARQGNGSPSSTATMSAEGGNGVLGSYSGTVHNPQSGRIDAKRVASFLGIPLRRLTEALGLAYGTVHKTPDAPSIQAALRPLAQIVELLNELSSGPQDIKVWLNRPLPELEGDSPLATILAGEAEAVETLLWNAREGIPA
jgi:hypothetical protein